MVNVSLEFWRQSFRLLISIWKFRLVFEMSFHIKVDLYHLNSITDFIQDLKIAKSHVKDGCTMQPMSNVIYVCNTRIQWITAHGCVYSLNFLWLNVVINFPKICDNISTKKQTSHLDIASVYFWFLLINKKMHFFPSFSKWVQFTLKRKDIFKFMKCFIIMIPALNTECEDCFNRIWSDIKHVNFNCFHFFSKYYHNKCTKKGSVTWYGTSNK